MAIEARRGKGEILVEYRRLGNAGVQVSAIGLGGNTFGRYADEAQTARIIHRAIDLGINFVDTAELYNAGVSEEYVGRALAGRRGDMLIATKVGMAIGPGPNQTGASRHRIMEALHNSLRRLGTDYVDLYQIHQADPATPIEETLRALDDLVRAGKVRYIGCSNYAAWQIVEAIWTSRAHSLASYVTVQPGYNLLNRRIEQELVPMCEAYRIGIIPYSPLAGGMLTGKYRRGEPVPPGVRGHNNPRFASILTERNFAAVEQLERFASDRGHRLDELALAWLLAQPMVCTVIAGATRPEQVERNAAAVDWKLTPEDLAEIDRITQAA